MDCLSGPIGCVPQADIGLYDYTASARLYFDCAALAIQAEPASAPPEKLPKTPGVVMVRQEDIPLIDDKRRARGWFERTRDETALN